LKLVAALPRSARVGPLQVIRAGDANHGSIRPPSTKMVMPVV
jgi:hypothetical protein